MELFLVFLAFVVLLAISLAEVLLMKRLVEEKESRSFNSKAVFSVFLAITLSLFIFAILLDRHWTVGFFNEKFSNGVDLRRVTVKGKQSFNAQIVVNYKDGKIERVDLIKGTTVMNKKDEGEEDDN